MKLFVFFFLIADLTLLQAYRKREVNKLFRINIHANGNGYWQIHSYLPIKGTVFYENYLHGLFDGSRFYTQNLSVKKNCWKVHEISKLLDTGCNMFGYLEQLNSSRIPTYHLHWCNKLRWETTVWTYISRCGHQSG